MRTQTAAVVTMEDINNYFTGPRWNIEVAIASQFEAVHEYVNVEIFPSGAQFAWHVEANDDSSDYDEGVSDKPVKAIAKFVGGPIPGGETFEKMAFQPEDMSSLFRRLADAVATGKIGPKRLAAVLRRARVLPQASCFTRLAVVVRAAATGDLETEEIGNLKKDMESKGWRVKESKSGADMPSLEVDISDTFTATIEVDSMVYSYKYEFKDRPELKKEGVAEDPIREFQSWYKSSEFKEAASDYKEAAKSKKFGESPTTPAKEDGIPAQEAKTVAPKKSA